MTSEMPGASGIDVSSAVAAHPGQPPQPAQPLDSARAAQFLATEHWSLLATRSMSWNESFSRSSMFLTSLSTATVSLALVGSATQFGPAFITFGLVVLSITLFLGVATFVRLCQVNNEDLYWVAGMNRLRGIYARLEPGIEDEFVSGTTLDKRGFALTYGALDVISPSSSLHVFVTTPGVIGIVCSAIAGVIAGLLTLQLAPSMTPAVGVGFLAAIISTALFIMYVRRDSSAYLARMIRFHEAPAVGRGLPGGGDTSGRAGGR